MSEAEATSTAPKPPSGGQPCRWYCQDNDRVKWMSLAFGAIGVLETFVTNDFLYVVPALQRRELFWRFVLPTFIFSLLAIALGAVAVRRRFRTVPAYLGILLGLAALAMLFFWILAWGA